jgi:hypothetical protein
MQKKSKKFRKMQKNSEIAVKFRIGSSSVSIASAFYPIKNHKKTQQNSINAHLMPKCK